MKGKTFFTILGLLLVQLLAAILLGMMHNTHYIEGIVAIIFAIASIRFIGKITNKERRSSFPAIIAFAIGFLNIVYLSFISTSLWLVIMLCLNAAGFILSLDVLIEPRNPIKRIRRKILLEKELPKVKEPKEIIYREKKIKPKKKTTRKKITKKTKKSKK